MVSKAALWLRGNGGPSCDMERGECCPIQLSAPWQLRADRQGDLTFLPADHAAVDEVVCSQGRDSGSTGSCSFSRPEVGWKDGA